MRRVEFNSTSASPASTRFPSFSAPRASTSPRGTPAHVWSAGPLTWAKAAIAWLRPSSGHRAGPAVFARLDADHEPANAGPAGRRRPGRRDVQHAVAFGFYGLAAASARFASRFLF